MAHLTRQTNPQASVIVWNYDTRFSSEKAEDPNKVGEVIGLTSSLVSISTRKSKSRPEGTFEMRLAPTNNWVSRITTGSWCAILMSSSTSVELPVNINGQFVDPQTFKMLGRIHDVRAVVNVDQDTGARTTEYIVTGEDWGSVFNTTLYIDNVFRNNNFEKLSFYGHAARLSLDDTVIEWQGDKRLPTSSEVIQAIIKIWGEPLAGIADFAQKTSPLSPDLAFTSQSQFRLPVEVGIFMKQGLSLSNGYNFASIIKLLEGPLRSKDVYTENHEDAFGFPDPNSFYGTNTFWQLIVENSNPILNETLADIRFEGDSPVFALYKRVRPFVTRNRFEGSTEKSVSDNVSMYKNVRAVDIPKVDIISVNAGTNWRDKVNFIEIKPQPQLIQVNLEEQVKTEAQYADVKAYERDGFKPVIQKADYLPFSGKEPRPLEAVKWKHLLREWYFNQHNMLNGAISFIGQDQYIQVGDNIRVDASIFGAPFSQQQADIINGGKVAYMLAHVENIGHNFAVDEFGSRSFVTTVQFVRGVIVDANNNVLSEDENISIDSKLSSRDKSSLQPGNTSTVSTPTDPITRK